jgi:uncharacterized membrane protein YphA (DoxX/SURF4 family)
MISLVAIIEIASLASDLPLFFSSNKTIIPQELMFLQSRYFEYLHPFYGFIERHNLSEYFYSWVIYGYISSLTLLLIGLFTRYAAGMATIFQLLIFKSFFIFNYGYDQFLTMSLFYCLMFPVGKYYSIDSKILKRSPKINFNYRRVLQLHLCMVYFFSGFAKALDLGWWNGNSLWKAVSTVDNSFYSLPPIFLVTAGIGTVLLELLYPFLIFKKSIRRYTLAAIILMHMGIAFTMGLYSFSVIMIVWNVAAFGNLTSTSEKKSINAKII